MSKDGVPRPVVWMGDRKKQLKKMPEDVQKQMGGENPPHSKMLKGLGSGVFEIRDDFDSNTYRLVYAVQIGKRLYVLHALQKKSKKGIATPPRDVELITRRYKEAVALEKELPS